MWAWHLLANWPILPYGFAGVLEILWNYAEFAAIGIELMAAFIFKVCLIVCTVSAINFYFYVILYFFENTKSAPVMFIIDCLL